MPHVREPSMKSGIMKRGISLSAGIKLAKHRWWEPFQLSLGLLVSVLAMGAAEAASGSISLAGNHPLTQPQAGDVLIAELQCAACHDGLKRSSLPQKTAPDLANVGARISPEYLREFLADPSSVHEGTTMPDMLGSMPQAEREAVAEVLTHFLIAQSTSVFASEASPGIDVLQGKALFHSVGCVACHGPRDATTDSLSKTNGEEVFDGEEDDEALARVDVEPIAFRLDHVAKKYSVKSLSEFLFQPLLVRSGGRMPDMKLTPEESLAIAGYLVGEESSRSVSLVPQEPLVALGEKYFRELNCVACHSLPSISPSPVVELRKIENLETGCLSESSERSPRFTLDNAQVQAIRASLRNATEVDTDNTVIAKTLTAFHCIACHVRDDFGGVHETHNAYFTTSDPKLGDDGRIPPPLTLVGAKLRDAWMKKVLFDGESVRHYMATRMPQYGAENLGHLPDVFSRLDVLESVEMNIPSSEGRSASEREHEKVVRAGGRELIGDKGVNCIACHQFNGKAATANQGMDLMTSYERLQPAWFSRYLRNPGEFRPRTIMPAAWPDGVAAFTTILEGSTDKQIEAIWYYLSLGTSAADPSGIRAVSTELSVIDHAVAFRGRSRVAGFRGIAVGFPEKLSYAFNAETGTLTALWLGEFIRVNWSGQGSGDFNPARDPAVLAQDVSFVQLASDDSPWPLMPIMTKEAPTNPDPLYPKNLGYQFHGYELDDSFVPTFNYRCGTIEIEDRSVAIESEEKLQLKRVFRFETTLPQTVWFRALTGEIVKETERTFRDGRIRLTIPATETKIRSLGDDSTRSELLLRLQLPQGKSSLEFIYEPLAK